MELEGARQVGKTYILDKFAREQYGQYIYIMLVKEKKGINDFVDDLSKIIFKEESGRVPKKMINAARSWLKESHIIGYCSKSIDCNHLDLVHNCRYYYMDLGVAANFLLKTGENEGTIRGVLCENYVYQEIQRRLKSTYTIAGDVPWFAAYKNTGGELDFYVRSLMDYKNYGIEGKAYGGEAEDGKTFTVPIYLAGRIAFDLGHIN